jgi:hypothetical protein
METPEFSRHIFWETDYDKIDWVLKARYVIERVIEYGDWEDWKHLKSFYGLEKIKEALIQARFLREKTLVFFSIIFDEPVENFRCYTLKQLNPEHFPS